ncbi:rhodanese-like domain-containing protein [Hymenobacter sp. BT188]|uniref:rhodanese-like domain-containing protein n=1 Tax=Hymenobacter sp. BT188 TaxID=2763504 RepID=UPI0016513324|nr:rhodanese-like domain-containing protein [Hymenobacter sp. BT188]MBC6607830.1 rhodanese-like domain-containing protein [Hymenobacter sp. BT188]
MTNCWRALVVFLGLLTLPACGQDTSVPEMVSPAYRQMLRTLYRETVPTIQAAALADMLRDKPKKVLVLDTRTHAEYKVSHLTGARFVDFDSFEKNEFKGLPRDQTVVVYCSVGYRSERVGERLKALGFRDVRNLYGGIFQWVNEGRPVYNAAGPTRQIHPYSALWSVWLRQGQQVY